MELRDIIAIIAGVGSIAVSFWTLFRARTALAVEKALSERRISELEGSVDTLKAELSGVKAGLDAGIGRVQDSLQGVADMLRKLETTVAILVDRDEREPRASRSGRTRTPRPSA